MVKKEGEEANVGTQQEEIYGRAFWKSRHVSPSIRIPTRLYTLSQPVCVAGGGGGTRVVILLHLLCQCVQE